MAKLLILFLILAVFTIKTSSVEVFPGLGSFNSLDFINPLLIFVSPQSPVIIGPNWLLYTKTNQDDAQKLQYSNITSLKNSNLKNNVPTIFLIFGWTNSVTKDNWTIKMKNKILGTQEANVIIVDWTKGASGSYFQAMVNTRVIGAMVAVQIENMQKAKNITLESIQIIGHSLGAHVSGFAGKKLESLGRITGLDPAGPLWNVLPKNMRLWKTDAQFVDVIHTSSFTEGMVEAVGHIDFYVNGGVNQPGCFSDNLGDVFNAFSCNHNRAPLLYIDAINEDVIPIAYQCGYYFLFKLGLCKDCDNGEKCAIFGPRAIESMGSNPGQHYFLESKKEKPYFN